MLYFVYHLYKLTDTNDGLEKFLFLIIYATISTKYNKAYTNV